MRHDNVVALLRKHGIAQIKEHAKGSRHGGYACHRDHHLRWQAQFPYSMIRDVKYQFFDEDQARDFYKISASQTVGSQLRRHHNPLGWRKTILRVSTLSTDNFGRLANGPKIRQYIEVACQIIVQEGVWQICYGPDWLRGLVCTVRVESSRNWRHRVTIDDPEALDLGAAMSAEDKTILDWLKDHGHLPH